jgi:hypothetical protein
MKTEGKEAFRPVAAPSEIDISIHLIDGINDYVTAAQNRLPWHHFSRQHVVSFPPTP